MSVTQNPNVGVFFSVTLDVVDLGYWTKCRGLGMTINVQHRPEAAMNFFQHHLPGHMEYDKLTLERPVSPDTATVMNWIGAYHMLPVPTSGSISALDQTGAILMSFEMFGVTPVSWKGPSFDAGSPNPGVETLELHHMGFM